MLQTCFSGFAQPVGTLWFPDTGQRGVGARRWDGMTIDSGRGVQPGQWEPNHGGCERDTASRRFLGLDSRAGFLFCSCRDVFICMTLDQTASPR